MSWMLCLIFLVASPQNSWPKVASHLCFISNPFFLSDRVLTCSIPFAMMIGAILYSHQNDTLGNIDSRRLMGGADGCPALESWEDGVGGAILYAFLMFYIFCGLAIICDDYFCESLEKISDDLNLSPNVAGATFMAAGSSAPELFVSLADNVFATEPKSLGVGTIVGSAIFNILIIIALTAALAGKPLDLDWRPLARDSSWYTLSIMLLLVFIEDKEVNAVEAFFLVAAYLAYVLYMAHNESVETWFCPRVDKDDKKDTAKVPGNEDEADALEKAAKGVSTGDVELTTVAGGEDDSEKTEGAKEEEVRYEHCFQLNDKWFHDYFFSLRPASVAEEGIKGKLWWAFSWPIQFAFRFTVPDCNDSFFERRRGFTTCFIMSIGWIALLSHFLVEFATKFGCIVGMPFPLMGLTIVAAGTSVPDAISSVVVARNGEGDMAVSNAIGSNVFDILLGLGLPYFLSNVIKGKEVAVMTDDLLTSVFILFGVLVAVIVILVISKWKLNPKVGMSLFLLYIGYVVFAYINGMD